MEILKELNKEINVAEETIQLNDLRKEKRIVNKRLLELDNERNELIKKTKLLYENERALAFIVAKNEWCTRNKVDKTIEFCTISIEEEDEEEDEFLTNSYEFTLDGIKVVVYIISHTRETYDEIEIHTQEEEEGYIISKTVRPEDLPENCKIAVQAIIDDQPDFN
jgi:hypothetical protein